MRSFSFLRKILFFFFLTLLLSLSLQATHIMGGDITYRYLGPNQYRVTLTLFRDCSGVAIGSSQRLSYSSVACGVNASLTLLQQGSAVDVTPVCSGQNSKCSGGSLLGIEQYVYSGTLNLPASCGNDWLLSWASCCRNFAITTLTSPGSQGAYLSARLDNSLVRGNHSPTFNSLPTPVLCINQPVVYNHGATDPDGDQLRFSLGNCQSTAAQAVNYGAGFSALSPLSSSSGFSIDSLTGALSFTPNAVQIGVICVIVEEYRNGVKIGETIRDMEFNVVNCSNAAPVVSGINGSSTYSISSCTGAQICFQLTGSDPDGDQLSLSWNQGIAGATFQVANNPSLSPTGTFCWVPAATDTGHYFFVITATDDGCPYSSSNSYAFELDIQPGSNAVTALGDTRICRGDSSMLSAVSNGALSYQWSPPTSLSDPLLANPIAFPTQTTVYTVVATFADGCNAVDFVTVSIDKGADVSIVPQIYYTCPSLPVKLRAYTAAQTHLQWSTGDTSMEISVSPTVNTDYWVIASDSAQCVSTDTATVQIGPPPAGYCNIIYVTPNGTGIGSRNDPSNLQQALSLTACQEVIIKMDTGIYVTDTAITALYSHLTLEGGFMYADNWKKSSKPGATTIFRTANNPDGNTRETRLVAMYIDNESDIRFQDFTIEVAGANLPSQSLYGVHLSNCSDYTFARIQIILDDAENGDDGKDGQGGQDGDDGAEGDDGDNNDPAAGGAGGDGGTGGGATATFRQGGAGGDGGTGGQGNNNGGIGGDGGAVAGVFPANPGGAAGLATNCITGITCASLQSGGNGANGSNGQNGANGANSSGGSHINGFFVPAHGQDGADGQGGQGGAGGGGGGGRGGACTSGSGSGGGGGGGGGEGGEGGQGGGGGGSVYGVYLYNNGANSAFTDCFFDIGNEGQAGAGGQGGGKGAGGQGANGSSYRGGGTVGCGGDGGKGGNGGNGGDGGDGADGEAFRLYQNSGTAPVSSIVNFQLDNQDEILMDESSCIHTSIGFEGDATTWNLGAGASPTSPFGQNVSTQYLSSGRKDIQNGSEVYRGFASVFSDSLLIPEIGTSAPYFQGLPTICAGESVNLYALNGGFNYVYHWQLAGTSPGQYNGTAYQVLTGISFSTPGLYPIILQFETPCCSQTETDTLWLQVEAIPHPQISGDSIRCPDGPAVTLTATGGSSYIWSPTTGITPANTATVSANPSQSTNYIVTAYSPSGACATQDSFSLQVNPLSLTSMSTVASCGANGSANVVVSGGIGPFHYLWSDSQTTATAVNLFPGTYQLQVTDSISGCADSIAVLVSSQGGLSVYIDSTSAVSCKGGANGNARLAVSGNTGNLSYSWTDLQGNPVDSNALAAGNYQVTVLDAGTGCAAQALFNIPEPSALSLQILNIDLGNCEPDSASAMVNASGGTGPFSYSWSTQPVQTGPIATHLPGGSYLVTVTDQNNCSTQITLTINCALPLAENKEDPVVAEMPETFQLLTLYPNPTEDELRMNLWFPQEGGLRLQIFDVQGRVIFAKKYLLEAGNQRIALSLGDFAQGVYEVVLGFDDGAFVGRKVFLW